MKKLLSLFAILLISSSAYALDPLAPKSERAFGRVKIKTPLTTDICEVKGKANQTEGKFILIPCAEMTKLLVGDYELVVKLQSTEWKSEFSIVPTEYTDVTVIGYGNIKVTTPNPKLDMVEVNTLDGKKVKDFFSKDVTTVPTGTYNLKIKTNGQEVPFEKVTIFSNTTRELSVSF